MLTFNLKKEWFEKIKSGEKTHEYREAKMYWHKRLEVTIRHLNCNPDYWTPKCEFVCGYAKKEEKEKRLKAKIKSIRIINGKNTDLKIDKPVFDIKFELLK